MIDPTTHKVRKKVKLNFTAGAVRSTLSDFVKTLKKEQIWFGDFMITGSDTFVLAIDVQPADELQVKALALQQGLFIGKTARSVRVRPAEAESEGEGGENDMATKKKQVKKASSAGSTKQKSKEEYRRDPNYFECKTCGHFVMKDKKERHFEKHPACRSQQPKAGKKAAGKKVAKKSGKKATKKAKDAAPATEGA